MIWYIVSDSIENYRQHAGAFCHHKFKLEELAQDTCHIVHYKQVNRKLLADARPWAICHSGGSAMYDTYDVLQARAYGECIKRWDIPQIGFCGGCQILAAWLGSTLGPLRQVRADEADHNPGYCPGTLKEWGIYPVRIVQRDPIFKGLGDTIHVQEYHSWEVKDLAPTLDLLATTDTCRVQAFVQRGRLLYGTQFHPEQSTDYYADGFKLIRNFFALAKRDQSAKS